MMPQQGAPTPGAMTGSLKNMPLEQLRALYQNPQPGNPPLWAVISALAEKQKEAQAMMAARGQSAMAQNAQMQQQPPIAAQVVQAAEQMSPSQQRLNPEQQLRQRLQRAINNGNIAEASAIMDMLKELEQQEFTQQEEPQSYAGGGAVAFQTGTGPLGLPFAASPARIDVSGDIPIYAPGPDKKPEETEAEYQARKQREAAEADEVANRPLRRLYRYLAEKVREPSAVAQMRMPAAQQPASAAPAAQQITDTGDEAARMLSRAPAPTPDTRVAVPTPGPLVSAGEQRQPVARPRSGIATLMGPQIDPYELEGRNAASAASEYQAALQKTTQLTPEQIAARQRIDEAMSGRKRFLGTEEQRRESLAEKRLQEALERSRVKPLEDITFIGQMLEGMRGTKRFGEGLAGLASGAGRAQAGRQAALRAAEDKYDLSRNDIFRLQDARNQLDMDEARLSEARATGDADKINAAAANVAKSKMDLAKVQADLRDRSVQRQLERERIDVERGKIAAAAEGTRAAREGSTQQRLMGMMASAEAKKQDLIRKITDDHKEANKQVYLMASIPGAAVTPDMMAQKQALDRQLAMKIRAATADLDKIIAQTASQIPGFGSLYGTSGGGLPEGVTVEKVQ
jgi:hypothetical protein